MIFDKTSDESLHIGTSNTFNPPYIFFLCDVIVQLYTCEIPEKDKILFEDALNIVNQESTKIIVGPNRIGEERTIPGLDASRYRQRYESPKNERLGDS